MCIYCDYKKACDIKKEYVLRHFRDHFSQKFEYYALVLGRHDSWNDRFRYLNGIRNTKTTSRIRPPDASSSFVSFTQLFPTCGRMPLPALSLWPARQPCRPRLVDGRRGGGPSYVCMLTKHEPAPACNHCNEEHV